MPSDGGISRGHATRDVLRQLAGRGLNLALGVVTTAILARALGRNGFGEWSSVLVVVQMSAYLADVGIEQVGVRRAAAEPHREAEWIGAVVALRAAISLPATLLAIGAVVWIGNSGQMMVAGLLASATILLAGPNSTRALLQLRVRNDINVAVMTSNSVLWGIGVAIVALSGAGIVAVAVAFAAAACVTTAIQVVVALRMGGIRFMGSRELWRPLATTGAPVAAAGLLVLAYARIDQVLVLELAGAQEAGLYAAVYRILEQAHFLPLTISATLLPLMAAAYPSDPARVRALLQTAAEFAAIASLPALAFSLVASEPIIGLLFGEEFLPAAPALPPLMGAFVLICFGYLSGNMVIVLGLQRRFLSYAIIALVFNVGLNLILVPVHGFEAAAWVTLATEVLVVGLAMRLVLRELRLRLRLGRMGRTALAAAGMALVVLGLRKVGAPVTGLIVAAVVSYPPLLLAARAISLDELRELRAMRSAQDSGSV